MILNGETEALYLEMYTYVLQLVTETEVLKLEIET
jgi:hypothetical protein